MNKDPSNSKIIHSSDLTANDVIKDEFDREYIVLLEEIENNLVNVSRHDLVRITAWVIQYQKFIIILNVNYQ